MKIDEVQSQAKSEYHPKTMVICGGGHVARQTVKLAKMTGFYVTVLEDRENFKDALLRDGADEVLIGDFSMLLNAYESDEDTYFVIVTRGHLNDRECLEIALTKPHAYIGMIGSKNKVKIVFETLEEAGISKEQLADVHAPIGLSINAETPEEIAIAILGEIIEIKNARVKNEGVSKELLHALLHLGDVPEEAVNGIYGVLATITKKTGSTPRGVGSRMLIYPDGEIVDTIGGGKGEADAIAKGVGMIQKGITEAKTISLEMTSELPLPGTMICGGTVEVKMEPLV